jgi:hypothetical protein
MIVTMTRPGVALATFVVLLVSCQPEGSNRTTPTRRPTDTEIGVPYPHKLFVHCGVLGTHFAGRDWDASPPLQSSPGNPPQGWDENEEPGTITLESADRATFRSSRGDRTATFVPRPAGSPDPNEGCE